MAGSASTAPNRTARYFRRVLAAEVPLYEAAGWRCVARDWSDSVGHLALLEWTGASAPSEEATSMSEPGKPNGVRLTAAIVAAIVSALAGTGAGVATHRLDPPPASISADLERRLATVESRVQTAEIERAAFSAGVTEKLTTLIDRVTALDAKFDRLTEKRR